MTHPTLSIVMPTYNRPNETKVMIDSIIASNFTDWELILVDDGSDEPTLRLLTSYAQTDSRICLHSRPRMPKGAQTCRNTGLYLSQGEYIIFFDSDDYICPECICSRVTFMRQHPELDFAVFPSACLDENGRHDDMWANNFGYPINCDDIKGFASRRLPFVVWNNIYRRTSLLKHRIRWDEQLQSFQDSDFNLSTIQAGMKYTYAIERPLFYYRIPRKRKEATSIVSEMFVKSHHQQSHLYLTQKWLVSVPKHYGHRYDSSLYDGIIFILRFHHNSTHSWHMGHELCTILHQYSTWMGTKLKLHIRLGETLQTFLSPSLAFKLSFLSYKVRDWMEAKSRIRKLKKLSHQTLASQQDAQ